MDYVETTQKGQMPRVEKPVKIYERQVMEIDGATRRSLELLESSSGDRGNSLLSVLDRTVTGAGARMLAGRIASPLVDTKEIGERLNVVEFFLNEEFIRDDVRALLKACPDIERAVSRLSLERGGPRDLAAIKTTLAAVPRLKNILSGRLFAKHGFRTAGSRCPHCRPDGTSRKSGGRAGARAGRRTAAAGQRRRFHPRRLLPAA